MVLMLSAADAAYMYPLVGFLGLSVVALVTSLFFWLRYRGMAKEAQAAVVRVQKAKDAAENELKRRECEYEESVSDLPSWDSKKQSVWKKINQMWLDYYADPSKYIGDELSGDEERKVTKIGNIWGAYTAVGGILVALLLLVLVAIGLWGVALFASIAFLFVIGFVVDRAEYNSASLLWVTPVSIIMAGVIALLLIPISGWSTSNPPPGWVAHTHEVNLVQKGDGTYGVGEPVKARLDGTVSKSAADAEYSWAEIDADNLKRSYERYYHSGNSKRVRFVDDLADGEEPYVVHYHTFDVLDGYADSDVCAKAGGFGVGVAKTSRCADRNAWSKRDEAVVHIPRGSYSQWVLNQS